jgi:hypothetical protein
MSQEPIAKKRTNLDLSVDGLVKAVSGLTDNVEGLETVINSIVPDIPSSKGVPPADREDARDVISTLNVLATKVQDISEWVEHLKERL